MKKLRVWLLVSMMAVSAVRPAEAAVWPEEAMAQADTVRTEEEASEILSVEVQARSGSPVQDYVTRLYQVVLDRTPRADEVSDWESRLVSGANTGAEVAAGFVFSDEYQRKNTSDEAYVDMLYRTLLGREPDAGGKADWLGWLSVGISRSGVFAGFANSAEFQRICDSYGVERGSFTSGEIVDRNYDVTAFVSRMYTVVLNRSWDRGGLYDWTGLLLNHEISGRDLARGFFFSAEFQRKNVSNEEFVRICYRTCLNREPDEEGWNTWMGQLQSGASRESVLDGFIGSREYTALCQEYGIERGSIPSAVSSRQQRVADIAESNSGTVAAVHGKCAAWVSGVYEAAGVGYPGGNAIDYWHYWKDSGSTDLSNIPVGAAVVGSGSTSSSGRTYGHVGIYLGGGRIAHNVGGNHVTISSLEEFEDYYCEGNLSQCPYSAYRGMQGILGWVWPNGQALN